MGARPRRLGAVAPRRLPLTPVHHHPHPLHPQPHPADRLADRGPLLLAAATAPRTGLLVTIARSVGDPTRLVAGSDCGFNTSAGNADVAPSVVWAKLRALRAGADLAS
jgi:hypothetical protein